MNTKTEERNGQVVAVVNSGEKIILDIQSALDFIASIQYETGSNRVVLNKEAITEDFFILKTKLAGEVLQKFINYKVKLAIYGDFSSYKSKALKDFIYESNNGNDIFFAFSEEEAVEMLSKAK